MKLIIHAIIESHYAQEMKKRIPADYFRYISQSHRNTIHTDGTLIITVQEINTQNYFDKFGV